MISILRLASMDICWTKAVMTHWQLSLQKFNNVLCLAVADCCQCMRTWKTTEFSLKYSLSEVKIH